jgi:hypothetical protein
MLNQKFYWGTIRKTIIAFGNLFNNIHIDRRNSAGDVVQTLKVPLSYAPRDKFIARIQSQPNSFEQSFQTFLPRMGFEMTSILYDPSRRISLVQQNRAVNSTSSTLNAQYAPTPYNIDISLYIYTKNQDDGLQIIEQILPYFNPDYNLTINAIPALGIKNDLPILLNSVDYDDQYEDDFNQRRAVIWTLNFTLKLNFFGPINRQGIIRTSIANTFNDSELTQRLQQYNVTVDPSTALPGEDIEFVENFEDF